MLIKIATHEFLLNFHYKLFRKIWGISKIYLIFSRKSNINLLIAIILKVGISFDKQLLLER